MPHSKLEIDFVLSSDLAGDRARIVDLHLSLGSVGRSQLAARRRRNIWSYQHQRFCIKPLLLHRLPQRLFTNGAETRVYVEVISLAVFLWLCVQMRKAIMQFTAILFFLEFSCVPLADMYEIWKNGIETAAYALICALSRFQKHSSERGLVRYSLFLATYHGLKVISYGMGTAACLHLPAFRLFCLVF
jgi:hypothetical protein